MEEYHYWLQSAYDQSVVMNGKEIRCFSRQETRKRAQCNPLSVVGETMERFRGNRGAIAEIKLAGMNLPVFPVRSNSRVCYRESGYVQVGEGSVVTLLKCRQRFWITGIAAIICVAIVFLLLMKGIIS